MSSTVSWVVNLLSQAGQERRRRIAVPSSAARLSITRVSWLWQKGQRTVCHPSQVNTGQPQFVDGFIHEGTRSSGR